jgi:hypothetical protein
MKRLICIKLTLFLPLLLSGSNCLISQTADTLSKLIENGWIEKMDNKITFDISFNNSYEIFEVKTATNKYIIKPNTPTNLRFHLNYWYLSFGFQYAPDFLPENGDEKIKGNTRSLKFETSMIGKHWFANIAYAWIKGFYLDNTKDYVNWNEGDPFIRFPDLYYNGVTTSIGYLNNSRFSLRNLTSQTERQLKSAGSFIPSLDLKYYIIDDRSSAVNTQKSNNLETSICPGYIYTYVVKEKFYFTIDAGLSFGVLSTKVTTREAEEDLIIRQQNFIFRWGSKAGLGYNHRKFYSGVFASISGSKYQQENTNVMNFETRVLYHFVIGIRLDAPDFLNKQVHKIEDRFPILK